MLEVNNFNAIRISLASPEQIRDWSSGEVTKPETINYRTLKPEKDGLFDERIFGPTKDWECYCGKYKRIRYKGIICDKCGVEVTRAKVRRERMGHIQLASPVSHIWYFKGTPSRLGILLDISPRNLERILYFALYIVTHVDEDARKRALMALDEEAEGRGGAGKGGDEFEDEQRALFARQKDELLAGQAALLADLEAERSRRTDEISGAAKEIQARLAELKTGATEETIAFAPTGEVVLGAGDKGSKEAGARLRKIATAESERVTEEFRAREEAEQRATEQKVADLEVEMRAAIDAHREERKRAAEGRKDEIRRQRDEIEGLKALVTLTETDFRYLDEKYGAGAGARGGRIFWAGMGAEAVRDIITRMELEELGRTLHVEVRTTSGQRRKKAIKRLRLIEAFRRSGTRPEWMILSVLPVLPPELRPMVQLDGGRFATSDLNDLYRRVINRNNRLKRLLELGAPEIIIRNEKRMLQEACDALVDNGRRGRAIAGTGNHRLKSLSDMLKGKQGRFRQNLLGKRVDYSGRSVIVAGPSLKLYQCGLPKIMALELFKPFIMSRLVERKSVQNIKAAKKHVESMVPEVWDVLEEVIAEHPVLLNRAPTLHRLGIQAFEPVLVEGKAIQVHPLVCHAFNADFDGDQMAVHVPLSAEAQAEARILMLSANNILSPASGRVLATPTQDMVLGIYYLTYCETDLPNSKAEDLDPRPKRFQNEEEVEFAIDSKQVTLQQPIEYRWKENVILTTAGRVIFNAEIDRALEYAVHVEVEGPLHEFLNLTLSKKELGDFIGGMVDRYGAHAVAATLDKIKQLGFHYATLAGITISKNDIVIPTSKEQILAGYEERVAQVAAQYERGLITEEERHESIVNIWTEATDAVADAMEDTLWELNPVFMMANSGARGSFKQIRQLAGMRGLMANPKGEIIERPIKANFMEGLSVLEYFISTHGARKGLADTALRTADSGYLTRRLVDVSQDVIVRDDDCGTTDFVELPIYLPEGQNKNLGGRVLAANVCRPVKDGKPGKTVIAEKGTVLSNPVLRMIIEEFGEYAATASLPVRSVLKCRSEVGVCQACYGIFLATGTMCEIGDSVGIIAAQSIGEPGTQLTMRTFHTGGVAGADITHGLPRVVEIFEARNPKGAARLAEVPGRVEIESTDRGYHVLIHQDGVDDKGEQLQPKEYTFARRSRLLVTDGQMVEPGDALNEGSLSPSELLELKGPTATELYLVGEVQKVYKSQGVDIHDKHVELIVRQMLKKVRVDNSGETELLPGQLADRSFVKRENAKARAESKEEATYEPLILGITKASLATESWLSAASFQETTKVLTDAAIEGKTDRLVGLKENVIIGKLIPAATGLKRYRTIEIKPADKVPVAAFVRPETGEQLLAELEEIGSDAGGGLATLLEEEPGGSVELETEAAGESDHDADNPSEKK